MTDYKERAQFKNLKGSELWPEVISYRLGDRLKATEEEKRKFAFCLELAIPNALEVAEVFNPDFEYVKKIHKKADKLMSLLEDIRDAEEKSIYIEDIISHSLSCRSTDMDFLDVFYFADAFKGFLEDRLKDLKRGSNIEIQLMVCQYICGLYEKILGKKPSCYGENRFNQSQKIDDCTPYERVCFEVERRYELGITWSTMKKASKTYKAIFDRAKADDRLEWMN